MPHSLKLPWVLLMPLAIGAAPFASLSAAQQKSPPAKEATPPNFDKVGPQVGDQVPDLCCTTPRARSSGSAMRGAADRRSWSQVRSPARVVQPLAGTEGDQR